LSVFEVDCKGFDDWSFFSLFDFEIEDGLHFLDQMLSFTPLEEDPHHFKDGIASEGLPLSSCLFFLFLLLSSRYSGLDSFEVLSELREGFI